MAYSIHLHHQTEIRLVQLAGWPIKKKEWIALKQNKVFNNSFFSASILVLLFFFKKEFRFSRIPRRASARSSLLVLLRPRLVGKPTRHTYIGGLTKRLILWSVHVFRIPEAIVVSSLNSLLLCSLGQKIFVCQLVHDALPTASLLHNRHLLNLPTCFRCHLQVETSLHALRDCPRSKDLWLSLNASSEFFHLHQFLPIAPAMIYASTSLGTLLETKSGLLNAIWRIWFWRKPSTLLCLRISYGLLVLSRPLGFA